MDIQYPLIVQMHMKNDWWYSEPDSGPWLCSIDDDYDEPTEMDEWASYDDGLLMNVEELLLSKDISFIPKGKDFLVRCLNPEHEDRNPSMRVDQITGIFNCFSCGYKGNLFTHFGQKANKMELKAFTYEKKLDEIRFQSSGLTNA